MNSDKNIPRLLGAAFLLQAVAPMISELFLAPVDMLDPSVSGNIKGWFRNKVTLGINRIKA
ncbi:MAG: hypothetical protein C00003105_02070 [ANME-2 cluster archaeon HR1]|nr:MAG: hypothetical protein C00003105_02070 [ANME-2 cluster archaeon HR1]